MKRTLFVISVLFSIFFLLGSCATTSLHSPTPNEPGEVTLGGHVGLLFIPPTDSSFGFPLIVNGIFRVGLVDHLELGINAGSLGADMALKYGFFPQDSPFQLSVLGGGGLYYWSFLDFNAGALTGVTLGDVVQIYGGYRQHFLLVSGAGLLPYGNIIGGVELFLGDHVSIAAEFDHTIFYYEVTSADSEDSTHIGLNNAAIPVLNAGLNLHF